MNQLSIWDTEEKVYARPTMAEINARPRNGLTCVGSFSGCGGSSLGLKMAGWNVRAAIEFVPAAADTYRANFPEVTVYQQDIREIDAETILAELGLKCGELDLFEGSPPCASFSPAGAGLKTRGTVCDKCLGRGYAQEDLFTEGDPESCDECEGTGYREGVSKKYSDTAQRTDDLFWEWARLLEGLNPRAFLAENVPGMMTGKAIEEYAWKITRLLSEKGYVVHTRKLNAANYGVPQVRERLIFVGIRSDVEGQWEWPAATIDRPVTIGEALQDVPDDDPDHAPYLADVSMEPYAVGRTWRRIQEMRKTHPEVRTFDGLRCDTCGGRIENAEQHPRWQNNPKGEVVKAWCADGREAKIAKGYFLLIVPRLTEPCPTITATGAQAGAASVTHPSECRKFTPAEAKALCGFPGDFILTGDRGQRYERMGRAVTPPMYEAVGLKLAALLRGES